MEDELDAPDIREFDGAEVMLEGLVWCLGGEVRVPAEKFRNTPQNHEVRFSVDEKTGEIIYRFTRIGVPVQKEGRA